MLKDKSDETIRQFMLFVKENKRLRQEIEQRLAGSLRAFMLARAVCGTAVIEEAVAMPVSNLTISVSEKNVMGVTVPQISVQKSEGGDLYPYSFATVSRELDSAISDLDSVIQQIVQLAAIEKTCNMLSDEIEKNRRRVNELEHILIPQTEETIKYIAMKLDENERGNIVRIMKVKELISKKQA
jgi:V/A-type H+-transporting ATPase subunit D